MDIKFGKQFDKYFQGCQDVFNKYWELNGYTHKKDEFSYKVGRRYIKVICGNSVHSFIDMNNGDVLKPAGHSKPAKWARGNIHDAANGCATMGPHGPAYLR